MIEEYIINKNNYKDLLIELTKKEIKIRYKNSYLGYLWSVLNPLFMAMIFYFVFKKVMKIDMEDYETFLIIGLFIWQWISNSFSLGTMLFIGNAGLIKKVNFKYYLLAIAMLLSEGFNFIFSIPIIIAVMFYSSIKISFMIIVAFPLLFVITLIFLYGWSLFLGTINLFFRDMERIIGIIMTLMFYATPIFYPEDKVPQGYEFILIWNPFSSFVIMWRDLFMHGTVNLYYIGLASLYAIFFATVGYMTYNKLRLKFAELL